MRPGGLPDNPAEAASLLGELLGTNFHLRRPSHYPDAQIVALSHLVLDLTARVQKLEAKPKRGRPPKSSTTTAAASERVRTERKR